MRYATFRDLRNPDWERYGLVLDDGRVVPLAPLLAERMAFPPATLLEYIGIHTPDLRAWLAHRIDATDFEFLLLGDVHLLAPIPWPRRDVICLGKNYRDHADEIAALAAGTRAPSDQPVFFAKSACPAIGPGAPIDAHAGVTACLDYEVELAVVIGRDAYRIPEDQVADHLFGYTILNDVSARDVQTAHGQWFLGKSLDSFCPMGPWIVDRDDLPYPPALAIRCLVNGDVRQSSNTSRLLFPISRVVSQLSQGLRLRPGDIVATGTPGGVGWGHVPPKFLSPGDRVVCEIEGIGALENPVV